MMANTLMQQSKILYQKANQVIPGGVNSPVRAFNNVGGHPLFIEKAKNSILCARSCDVSFSDVLLFQGTTFVKLEV